MSKLKHLLAILVALSVVLLSQRAHATHFRYGNITYSLSDNSRTVRFEVVTAWNPKGAVQPGTVLKFGDGEQIQNDGGFEIGKGLDASGLEYVFTKYVVTHTYAGTATQFVASFEDCCRISTLINAPDGGYKVSAKVDLSPGNTGNPRSFIPAIIQLQTGGLRSHFIPATDPDGTPVTCRFSTATEAGGGNMPGKIPGNNVAPVLTASSDPPGCLLTWNTTGGQPGQQYATHVTLESVNPANNQINSAQLDYIIEFVQAPVPTCEGSGTFIVPMGTTLTTNMIGTNKLSASGGPLTITTIYSNGVITPKSGITKASPFTSTLTWSPGAGEAGTYLATVMYTDQKIQSGFCSITLVVPPCAEFGQACSVGTGQCKSTGVFKCDGAKVECVATEGAPGPELCDNIDNNCDGQVDEDNPEAGQVCDTKLSGECSSGISTCAPGGVKECVPNVTPGTLQETCNNKDDDCNGTVDDSFNTGTPCSPGVGACQANGVIACDDQGGSACNVVAGTPASEACNGIDDDCDGDTDEDFNLGGACTTGLGACEASGILTCNASGAAICKGKVSDPTPEVCGNDVDEDCDGAINNGCTDSDQDGVFDSVEKELGLDPADVDSDDDGVPDGAEPSFAEDSDGDGAINALDPDSDNDGLFDGSELGLDCSLADTKAELGHCRADADKGATKTDPLKADTDEGGALDGSEDWNLNGQIDADETDANEKGDDGSVLDTDLDGLSDKLEVFLGMNPKDMDSDDDGVLDGEEPSFADDTDGDALINALDPDSDNDALFDGTEIGNTCKDPDTKAELGHCRADANHGVTRTSPLKKDTDGGGVSDGSEDTNLNGLVDPDELDPSQADDDAKAKDVDGDGLSDELEKTLGSQANDEDSDDDGLFDGDELNVSDDHDGDGKLNLVDADSDNDGLFDGTEAGKDCSSLNTSASGKQCIADADKGVTRTLVLVADSDKGGTIDGDEDENQNGVIDAEETDPLNGTDDVPPECKADVDCGGAASGRVCESKKCVSGCHSDAACAAGQVCDALAGQLGTCKPKGGSTSGGPPEESDGCGCSTVGNQSSSLGWLLFATGAALVSMRRRRDPRPTA